MEIQNQAYQENKFGFYTFKNQSLENKINIKWNFQPNYNGFKPPMNQMSISKPQNKDGYPKKHIDGYPLFQITQRDPYKVQYMVNGYGGLQTTLGTMLGT